jgi:hypothetical protein
MPQWWSNRLEVLEQHLIPCPFKFLTGCDCPACGTQRSFLFLLKGELSASWNANPAGIGVCLLVGLFAAGMVIGRNRVEWSMQRVSWLLLSLILVKWGLKLYEGTCCS